LVTISVDPAPIPAPRGRCLLGKAVKVAHQETPRRDPGHV